MIHRQRIALVIPVVLAIAQLAGNASPAAQGGGDQKSTRVALAGSSAEPGEAVLIPIYINPGPGLEIGKIKVEVNYVSANMKYEKSDPGTSIDSSTMDFQTEVNDGKNDKGVDTQTIAVSAALKSPQSAKSGIPSGLLAFLTLRLSKNGRPAVITLRTTAEGSELKSGKALENIQIEDAKVEVLAEGTEPAVACFFFTH